MPHTHCPSLCGARWHTGDSLAVDLSTDLTIPPLGLHPRLQPHTYSGSDSLFRPGLPASTLEPIHTIVKRAPSRQDRLFGLLATMKFLRLTPVDRKSTTAQPPSPVTRTNLCTDSAGTAGRSLKDDCPQQSIGSANMTTSAVATTTFLRLTPEIKAETECGTTGRATGTGTGGG